MKDLMQSNYKEVVDIIKSARERAFSKVNEELILMYRDVGKYISERAQDASYGEKFVDGLADFFAKNYPELKGFTRRGLYRMKQFYERYKDDEKVSKERYSARELSRQIDSAYYERYMLSQKPTTPAITQTKDKTGNVFSIPIRLIFLICQKRYRNMICKSLLFAT